MKRLMLAVGVIGVTGGTIFYLDRQKAPPIPLTEPVAGTAPGRTMENTQPVKAVVVEPKQAQVSASADDSSQSPPASVSSNEVKAGNSTAFSRTIDLLVSPQTSFHQKQADSTTPNKSGNSVRPGFPAIQRFKGKLPIHPVNKRL